MVQAGGSVRARDEELNEDDVALTPGELYKTMSYGTTSHLFQDDDASASVVSHGDSTV